MQQNLEELLAKDEPREPTASVRLIAIPPTDGHIECGVDYYVDDDTVEDVAAPRLSVPLFPLITGSR